MPRIRWNQYRCRSRAAGSRCTVSGGRTSPYLSPHHSPGLGSRISPRCAGHRRPPQSRVAGNSSNGVHSRPSRSTTTNRNPANLSTRAKVATVGTRLPASIREIVLCGTPRYRATSRWLVRVNCRTRRTYPTLGNSSMPPPSRTTANPVPQFNLTCGQPLPLCTTLPTHHHVSKTVRPLH
jgi:hypothetical protein